MRCGAVSVCHKAVVKVTGLFKATPDVVNSFSVRLSLDSGIIRQHNPGLNRLPEEQFPTRKVHPPPEAYVPVPGTTEPNRKAKQESRRQGPKKEVKTMNRHLARTVPPMVDVALVTRMPP